MTVNKAHALMHHIKKSCMFMNYKKLSSSVVYPFIPQQEAIKMTFIHPIQFVNFHEPRNAKVQNKLS